MNPGIIVSWIDGWRLPTTFDGPFSGGYDGTTTAGYNITTSEMGHLYNESLGNKSYYATDGTYPQPGWGLQNTYPFDNLYAVFYTGRVPRIHSVRTSHGSSSSALATRTTERRGPATAKLGRFAQEMSPPPPVPEPAAMLLLGLGLLGVVGMRKLKE